MSRSYRRSNLGSTSTSSSSTPHHYQHHQSARSTSAFPSSAALLVDDLRHGQPSSSSSSSSTFQPTLGPSLSSSSGGSSSSADMVSVKSNTSSPVSPSKAASRLGRIRLPGTQDPNAQLQLPFTRSFRSASRQLLSSSSSAKHKIRLVLLPLSLVIVVVVLLVTTSEERTTKYLPSALSAVLRKGSSNRSGTSTDAPTEGEFPLRRPLSTAASIPNPPDLSSIQHGSLVLLPSSLSPPSTSSASLESLDLSQLLCDVFRISGALSSSSNAEQAQTSSRPDEQEEEGEERPAAGMHITFAFQEAPISQSPRHAHAHPNQRSRSGNAKEADAGMITTRKSASLVSRERTAELVRSVSRDPKCGGKAPEPASHVQVQAGQEGEPGDGKPDEVDLPSISVTSVKAAGLEALLERLQPRIVISTKHSGLDRQARTLLEQEEEQEEEEETDGEARVDGGDQSVEQGEDNATAQGKPEQRERPTWISMPLEDLPHAGWIFSLPFAALESWHTPAWKINVITNDRAVSLARLYKSLQMAHYFGDAVDLTMKIEATADEPTVAAAIRWTNSSHLHPASQHHGHQPAQQPASDQTAARKTEDEPWRHGSAAVSFRFRQAGLITNIVEAWYPTSNDEYGFFFEDDIEASPFYFAYAKMAILKYRYSPFPASPSGSPARLVAPPAGRESLTSARTAAAPVLTEDEVTRKNLYGISLIQQKTSELDRKTGRIMWNAADRLERHSAQVALAERAGDTVRLGALPPKYEVDSPYLSQVPSSWGAVFFPESWREFHDYIQIRDTEEVLPRRSNMIQPSVVSDQWEGSWKRYLIELVFLRGYTMLYPNYRDFLSLSTNHVELGEHINTAKQKALREMQEVPLMQRNALLELPGSRLPRSAKLPVFDLWGALAMNTSTLIARGVAQHRNLWKCSHAGSGVTDHDAYTLFSC